MELIGWNENVNLSCSAHTVSKCAGRMGQRETFFWWNFILCPMSFPMISFKRKHNVYFAALYTSLRCEQSWAHASVYWHYVGCAMLKHDKVIHAYYWAYGAAMIDLSQRCRYCHWSVNIMFVLFLQSWSDPVCTQQVCQGIHWQSITVCINACHLIYRCHSDHACVHACVCALESCSQQSLTVHPCLSEARKYRWRAALQYVFIWDMDEGLCSWE